MPKRASTGFDDRRAGGARQRIAAAVAEAQAGAPVKEHSRLVAFILEQWSWGFLTTPKAQAFWQAAHVNLILHAEGRLRIGEVCTIANIGAQGQQSKPALRDLERRLVRPALSVSLHSFRATIRSDVSRFVTMSKEQTLLLPHVFLLRCMSTINLNLRKCWSGLGMQWQLSGNPW